MRYRLQGAAAKALPKERVSGCGRPAGPVGVRNGKHGAYFDGLFRCGSVWTCPVCASRISEVRRQEVAEVLSAWEGQGGTVYMAMLTLPHNRGQTCRDLKGAVAGTWQRLLACRPYARLKARLGGVHWARALEVTYGDNGWHPHLHLLVFFRAGVTEDQAQAFGAMLFEQWAKRVEKAGFGECNPELWRFERAEATERAGDYVTKWGADHELTHWHVKEARGGGRSPWQLLHDIGRGDRRAIMRFREYAAAFKGARQLTWSRGLREEMGLRDPKSDEDAALSDPEEDAPCLAVLPVHVFQKVRRKRLQAALLAHVEAHPSARALEQFLKQHGIDPYARPPERPPPHAGRGDRRAPSGFDDWQSHPWRQLDRHPSGVPGGAGGPSFTIGATTR